MPNHCYNNLNVSGDRAELERFISAITVTNPKDGEAKFCLSQLMPMPEVLEGTTSPTPSSPEPHPNWAISLAEGKMTQEWHDELVAGQREKYEKGQKAYAETGYHNWYDWAHANWGTKWGDYENDLSNGTITPEHDSIDLNYSTAWCPFSEGFFAHASQLFPTLSFRVEYEEQGMGFLGVMTAKNGEVQDFYDEINTSDLPDPDEVGYDAYNEAYLDLFDRAKSTLDSLA